MGNRVATIEAVTVEVQCPDCGGSQPNPKDGSFLWLPSEVQAAAGTKVCVECDEEFLLVTHGRVSLAIDPPPPLREPEETPW